MPVRQIEDIDRLRRINEALMERVERSMDQQGNAFTLFQTAITLDSRIRQRTDELTQTLRRLEQSNDDLIVARDAAEQANVSKTRFIAAASHDVLQPLNAAHLSISALADLQTSDEGRRLAQQVERALETMDELLRTLLDISRLDAGVVRPEFADVALQPLFLSLISDFSPTAEKKRLVLRFRPTTAVVRTDRTMYRRVLQNIVSNALRYTHTGGVHIGARRSGDLVTVQVTDTGTGIPADQHEAVYDEFHRGVNAVGNDPSGPGLGLGLSIVRRLIHALGHRIALTSRVGNGTIFRVTAPAVRAMVAPPPLAARQRGPRVYGLFGIRVLLIENDDTVADAMRTLLERWHCSVRTGCSNASAFEALGDTDWVPDIIIADQHLDQGDLGSRTIEDVRAFLGRRVPGLIVTADPSDGLANAARATGIELMRKPVKPAELRALIAHMLA